MSREKFTSNGVGMRVPKELRALLQKMGRIGGRRSLETMAPAARAARAKKAGLASGKARRQAAAKRGDKKQG